MIDNECRDCGRHMLLFARRLCAACYKLRWKHGRTWDGPPPRSNLRRIYRNCYRIRREAGDRECVGPPPDKARPTEWPARGHWTVRGRPARPEPEPNDKVDWRAMADVIRVLR